MFRIPVRYTLILLIVLSLLGCGGIRSPRKSVYSERYLLTTGYCKCKKCSGWRRNWLLQPVFASGPNKGKRKKVGITASGTKAKKGTIAADTRYYPFRTVMKIPGYGYGRVEDRGSAIKGNHIDLYFKKHKRALKWGKQKKRVKVWIPKK